ncbi:MAG: PHP domain-containing protein [Anaerolineaceae bacterium]
MGTGIERDLTFSKMSMIHFRAEFHIHSVLSPCAGIEMIPPWIVEGALSRGINLIAITDHNASYNAPAVIKAAEGTDLTVLPGMELETAEEIHSVCLFDTLEQLAALQEIVDRHLPKIPNNVDFFGSQLVVDEEGEFVRFEDRLLINSTRISLQDACKIVTKLGGLFIPAHVDREAYGVISHLGAIPPDLPVEIVEISRYRTKEACRLKFPELQKYHLIQSGDVHFLDDFLGANEFYAQDASLRSIKEALIAQF